MRILVIALLIMLATNLSAGQQIAEAQRLLNALSYSAGSVDGVYGSKTERAIVQFYKDNGKVFDGKLGENELDALKNKLDALKRETKNKDQIVNDLVFPKYFYTGFVNKACKIKRNNNFYSSPIADGYDLNNLILYEWLVDLKNMSWKAYHDNTSNSLTVEHGVITKRMMRLQTIITESIISDNLKEQAPKIIEILIAYADSNFILDSTTEDEIENMRKSGTYKGCYAGGTNNETAVCHAHTAQEAARYAGQYIILATQLVQFMKTDELDKINGYIETLFKNYIDPWYYRSGVGEPDPSDGYYQMGHGGISKLAYAHWRGNNDIAFEVFTDTFDWINLKLFGDGLIANNTFRGTRGWWYHHLALNNMLGMVALAEQWNYPIPQTVINKLTQASAFTVKTEPKSWTEMLFENYEGKGKYVTEKTTGREIYLGNVTWNWESARLYIHQGAFALDHMVGVYTDTNWEGIKGTQKYRIYENKKKKATSDYQLGFNPICITR